MRRFIFALVAFTLPVMAYAAYTPQDLQITTGITPKTIPDIIGGVINIMHGLAFAVTFAVFIVGALMMAASGGNEGRVGTSKTIMQSAMIGMAIISGSWMILSTFVSFLIDG